jgi:hypothetical protein
VTSDGLLDNPEPTLPHASAACQGLGPDVARGVIDRRHEQLTEKGPAMKAHARRLSARVVAFALALSASLLLSTPALASQVAGGCQAQWIPSFGERPGTDGYVHSMATFDNGAGPALYAAGVFNTAGGVAARGLAKWDGARWSQVGSTIAGDLGYLLSLTVFNDGAGDALYVSGPFTSIDGVSANYIAKWDGSTWTSLGAGLNGVASELVVFDDGSGPALFAGGSFTMAGSAPANHVAKWDGTSWSALGSGTNGPVYSLAGWTVGDEPALYVGGQFESAGGVSARFIAKWNGSSWSSLAGSDLEAGVNALAVYDDGSGAALYVGGRFTTAGGGKSLAKWDGVSWSFAGLEMNASVSALSVHDDGSGAALFVGGYFTFAVGLSVQHIAKWNGSTWSGLGGGILGGTNSNIRVETFATFDGGAGPELFAGGSFWSIGGASTAGIARWDGTRWRALGEGLNQFVRDAAVFDDGSGPALYLAGSFTGAGSVTVPNLVRRAGGQWSAVGGSLGGSGVYCVAVHDDGTGDALFAGGSFWGVTGAGSPNMAKWDGAQWLPVGTGLGQPAQKLASVDDGTGAKLFAVGHFTVGGSQYIARWDGVSWQGVGAGTNDSINALVEFDDGSGPALYVGGKFSAAGAVAARHIAKWDGTAWSKLGVGVGGEVYCLTVFDDGSGPALYAGGSFQTAGGIPASRVAKWDGATWSPLGSGIGAYSVEALAAFDDGSGPALFAGGWFGHLGLGLLNGLRKWDGVSWSAVPGLSDGAVTKLIVFDDRSGNGPTLHVGGRFFTSAGGDSYLANYGGCTFSSSGTSYCSAGMTSSGCVPRLSGNGAASATATSGFTLSVAGAPGSTLGRILYGVTGPQSAPWSTGTSFACVRPPHQRLALQGSGGSAGQCNGTFSIDWNQFAASHPTALGAPFAAGELVWAQGWMRDGSAPSGSNLSDGLVFVLAP